MKKKTAGRFLAGALTATTVLGLPIVLTGCPSPTGPGEELPDLDPARIQDATTIAMPFGQNLSVVVESDMKFTGKNWITVTSNIKSALQSIHQRTDMWDGWDGWAEYIEELLHYRNYTIIIKENPEFPNFSVTTRRLYINSTVLNNPNNLMNALTDAILGSDAAGPIIGQAIPSARETVHMAKAPTSVDTKAIVAQALGEKQLNQIASMHRAMGLQKA